MCASSAAFRVVVCLVFFFFFPPHSEQKKTETHKIPFHGFPLLGKKKKPWLMRIRRDEDPQFKVWNGADCGRGGRGEGGTASLSIFWFAGMVRAHSTSLSISWFRDLPISSRVVHTPRQSGDSELWGEKSLSRFSIRLRNRAFLRTCFFRYVVEELKIWFRSRQGLCFKCPSYFILNFENRASWATISRLVRPAVQSNVKYPNSPIACRGFSGVRYEMCAVSYTHLTLPTRRTV